jgi:periplasmic protein CpxP/Spy
MKRENLLLWMVAILIVINGAILFYFLQKEGNPPPHRDKLIVEALQFDDNQRTEFDRLKRQHRNQINELDDKFKQSLENYFLLLRLDTETQLKKDSIENVLTSLEQERVRVTYAHFQDLKNLCRADQQEKFNAFIPQLIEFIVKSGPKRDGPPRRN